LVESLNIVLFIWQWHYEFGIHLSLSVRRTDESHRSHANNIRNIRSSPEH